MQAGDDIADDPLYADRALVESVLVGAPGAFERLVREYQGLCWHVVQRMVRQPDDARELCQETFLRVHQCLHQYRGDSALKSWIAQVAYSVAKRHLERRRIPLAEAQTGTSATASTSRPQPPTAKSPHTCTPRSTRCRRCSARC